MTVAGVGPAARFQPADDEIRFSFRFEILTRDTAGTADPARRVHTTGRPQAVTHGERRERGRRHRSAMSACLRGCAPILSTSPGTSASSGSFPICCSTPTSSRMVVELDTRRLLDPAKGSLFGAIAETVPISQQRYPPRTPGPPHRLGWTPGADQHPAQQSRDVGDRRSYATCGISRRRSPSPKELQPLFLQRLKDSFATWDLLDGKADWTPEALAANANVFLDDFLLFDVAKPITDDSHLEIEKSTIGRASLPDRRRPHDRCELDRHPAHLAGQSRS